MKIDSLEKVTINGSGQWLLIRGENPNAPLILQVQAGPGFPIIPEASAIEKRLHLEENYLDLLEVASSGNRFKEWLEKLESMSGYNSTQTQNQDVDVSII